MASYLDTVTINGNEITINGQKINFPTGYRLETVTDEKTGKQFQKVSIDFYANVEMKTSSNLTNGIHRFWVS